MRVTRGSYRVQSFVLIDTSDPHDRFERRTFRKRRRSLAPLRLARFRMSFFKDTYLRFVSRGQFSFFKPHYDLHGCAVRPFDTV
jgi:hypothetical protein